MQKHVILVAGTHRSGTSLLNGLLNLHGVALPEASKYADEFNECGYWESFEVQRINDEILRLGDSSWFDFRRFSLARQSSQAIEELEQEVSGFCERVLADDAHVLSIKDPRICRLLPIWRSALEGKGAKVSAIIPYRNPLEVAASLRNRDGFSASFCMSIWLRNVLDAEVFTRELDRAFCSYQSVISDWPDRLSNIKKKLKLSSLQPLSAVQDQVQGLISESLKHWSYSDSDLSKYAGADGLLNRAYKLLMLIDQDDSPRLYAELDCVRKEFETVRSITDEIEAAVSKDITLNTLRMSLQQEASKVNQQKARIRELGKTVSSQKHLIKRVKIEKRDLVGSFEEITGLLEDARRTEGILSAEVQATNIALNSKEKQIVSLADQLSSHQAAYKESAQELADLHERFQSLDEKFQGVNAHYAHILNSVSWKITWPYRILLKYFYTLPNAAVAAWYSKMLRPSNKLITGDRNSAERFALIGNEIDARVYVPITTESPPDVLPVKLISFYLPQFHPIPENDAWWGEGFTEWTNVRSAQPQFVGHYQPRAPGELGYYDLRNVQVQKRQVELAKLYGVGGFCFYYYWFKGIRLLEAPLLQYLENKELDLPFCLCWANESWSRRWDGLEDDILIRQRHTATDDLAFIEYVSKFLFDGRYIRVKGRPLLVVYRPNLFPDIKESAGRWREWCRANGVGEIFLAYTQSFEAVDPTTYGFDAAIEFPPNNTDPEVVTNNVDTLSKEFSGFIYDWTSIASRSRDYQEPEYPLFRTVNPSWDNTARRGNAGAIFAGTTPETYGEWLNNAAEDTVRRFSSSSERLTFVNAWNEWAEGAYLEPDSQYGYAYLQATRNALARVAPKTADKKIALVIHDAFPHGAQYLTLYLAYFLSTDFGFDVDLVVLGDGILLGEYERWATVHRLTGHDSRGPEARALARKLALLGNRVAICNTTVSGLFLETLADEGLRCVALVHELRKMIDSYDLYQHAEVIGQRAECVVFAVQQVANSFLDVASVPQDKIIIRPQGLYKRNAYRGDKTRARTKLRSQLGLDEGARIVLGVGYIDHRKGVDLFVDAGVRVIESLPDTYFVWVGHSEAGMQAVIESKLAASSTPDNFLFVGRKDNTDLYYAGADIFVLSSREDPFPTTVMESLEVGVPVIGFKDAGGAEELLNRGCGLLVPYEDSDGLGDTILDLLDDQDRIDDLGKTGASIITKEFSFQHYVYDLLDLAGLPAKRVSVIVPNYNYGIYIEQRLKSIFSQSYPIFEVIVLDDASTDNSVDVIKAQLATQDIDCQLIRNDQNSGSVSRQWQKGVQLARSDFVWICEADDVSEPTFLEEAVKLFDDEDVVLSYTQSMQIDGAGKIINNDYLDYTADICKDKWKQDYISDGAEELAEALAIKNSIPNVSAVVFRKSVLEQSLNHCIDDMLNLTVAGDWLLYSDILLQGRIGFVSKSLNRHRRHAKSVTLDASNSEKHMAEIIYMHDHISNSVGLDAERWGKALQFEKHAYRYLNLGSDEGDPREHAGVSDWLDQLSR